MRSLTTASSLATPSSGPAHSTKWKSPSGSRVRSGIWPRLIRCALVMIRLAAACRNTSVRRTTGTAPDAITSASTCPGPTEGSWSTSPTSSSAARCGTARSSACASGTSSMLVSSTTSRSHSSGRSSSRLNPPVFGSVSSSRWMVLAPSPVLSEQALRRPAGRGGQRHLGPLRDQHLEDRVDQRGLADAGAAGDHQHLRGEREAHRRALALRQGEAGLAPDPVQRLVGVDRRPGRRPVRQPAQPLGDAALGPVQAGEEHAGAPVHLVGDHVARPRAPASSASSTASGGTSSSSAASVRSSSPGRPQWPSSIASASA